MQASKVTVNGFRRAFSLVEMLTVLAILAIVLGILIPALASVRNAARKTATQGLMTEIANAMSAFQTDQKRLPGYFTAREMGSMENRMTYGFTAMENAMLDLAGGVSRATAEVVGNSMPCDGPGNGGPSVIQIGPTMTAQVFVDLERMGAAKLDEKGNLKKSYLPALDPKYFARQCGNNARIVNTATDKAMPVPVDAFGQPILAWIQDETATESDPFGAEDSTDRARFYWASNAGFLRATSVGKIGGNQKERSLLGEDASGSVTIGGMNYPARVGSLYGLLGNPASGSAASDKPGRARAPIVLHSAGENGVYLGRGERGAKAAAVLSGATGPDASGVSVLFKVNQDPITGGGFDDLITPAGN